MDGGGWSSLPVDLLKEVSGRLSSDADYLRIHQVCPHWRAFTVPPAVYRPWLVAGRHGRSGLQLIGEYSLRLLRGDAPGTGVRDPPAGLPYCCGASWGCLALVDDDQNPTRLVLWEPLSNTEISLPCLRPITWIFLSDDPLTSADWIVIASQLQGVIGQRTLFWRPGDASWSILNGRGTSQIDTITFLDGKAYYIDIRRNIIVCDFNLGTDLFPKYTPIYHVCNVVNRICKCDRLHPVRGAHLVACNRDLLLVVFFMETSHTTRRWLKSTRRYVPLTCAWSSLNGSMTLVNTRYLLEEVTRFRYLQKSFPRSREIVSTMQVDL
ncbi:hypothetical protein QOZ80_6AG0511200 [Eleusine coracana subsp. coracana]|nr:hypothetical protein QOZ80_6AG0511200 [Eleusine coracana subsp. coracana]